jgi:phage terminase small subunit
MPALKNAKHEALAQAYIADRERIGWRAYKAVYPKSSQRAAETGFSRLLKNAEFAGRVAELDEKAADSGAVMSARAVLEELSNLAGANMLDYMRAGANGDPYLHFDELTRDQAAALAEVTVEDFVDGRGDDARDVRKVRFKLHSKLGALELLARHYGMLKDVHEHDLSGKVYLISDHPMTEKEWEKARAGKP